MTNAHPTPAEYRKGCGKTQSEATAAATVAALKETMRPMGPTVLRIVAQASGPDRASSSLYLDTMKRL